MATATIAPSASPLDTAIRLVTPERITFEYPLAGPFRRLCSYSLDLLVMMILAAIGLIVSLALTLGNDAGQGLFLVYWFFAYWFYGAFCEAVFNGQTAGKWVLGLRVVSVQGVPIRGGQAMIRNLLGAFEGAWPFLYLPALASMTMTRRFQRLGDLAAGTMVIVERRPRTGRLPRPKDRESDDVLAALPTGVHVGSELSRGLADFVKRRARFSRSRREEIARPIAEPLRRRYGLPDQASGDAILCALYRRVFLGE